MTSNATFTGYHQFRNPLGEPYGSFEVFEMADGWYWWPCFPGCLPDADGEISGPFPTAEGAYLAALGD